MGFFDDAKKAVSRLLTPEMFRSTGTRIRRSLQDYVHQTHPRVHVAAASAAIFLIGSSVFIQQQVSTTQVWQRVFTDGKFVGLVPARTGLLDEMHRLAEGYHIGLKLFPIHTSVDKSYNWHLTASLPVHAASIELSGRPVAYVSNRKSAWQVLDVVKKTLTPKGLQHSASVQFSTPVAVKSAVVGAAQVLSTSTATHMLLNPVSYTPSARSVSFAHTSASQLTRTSRVSASPTTTEHSLQSASSTSMRSAALTKKAVQVLSSKNAQRAAVLAEGPKLSVVAKEQVVRTVHSSYPIKYVDTNQLGTGALKVVQAGHPGIVREKVALRYVNGKLVRQDVLSKVVVRQAQTEIADKGTNSGIAAGSWGWPTTMYDITSPFGSRTLDGSYNFHPGVDIGVPIGTPIFATNNGVVEEAGWNSGGYGNWVRINNGNGIETIFGHMSRVVASAGEVVARGTLIGYSGETGFATGPHLHYEVRINGTPVPPSPYM